MVPFSRMYRVGCLKGVNIVSELDGLGHKIRITLSYGA